VLLGLVLVLVTAGIAIALVRSEGSGTGAMNVFALLLDGPTRARMALFATIALIGVVALGALKDRLPTSTGTWRVLHAYLAAVAAARSPAVLELARRACQLSASKRITPPVSRSATCPRSASRSMCPSTSLSVR
jgi:hypothetical protein